MRAKIYGCRGSVPMSHPGSRYGGNTSCMILDFGGEPLIIDAGSGLMSLGKELEAAGSRRLNILLSHLHLDHIIGLGTFIPAWGKDAGVRIFTASRDSRPLMEQVLGVFAPPYWPVSMQAHGNVECVEISHNKPFQVGAYNVTPFRASHPSETLSYHITAGGKTVVHLLDSEVNRISRGEHAMLAQYCQGADLVVFDAAYAPEDYQKHQGWGHSTVKDGVKLAGEVNCKRMVFAHFSQNYTDGQLDGWRGHFCGGGTEFILAHDGLEIDL